MTTSASKYTVFLLLLSVMSTQLTLLIISHRWEKRHSIIRTPWNEIGRREVLEFAIVQKDPRGFEILHEKYKKRLQRYGVSPSMWIFRKLLCSYFTTFKLNLRTL